MLNKKDLERINKYLFFGLQAVLFIGVAVYFINIGKGFGIHTFFWFVVFSMPLCIVFGIIAIIIDKKKFKK